MIRGSDIASFRLPRRSGMCRVPYTWRRKVAIGWFDWFSDFSLARFSVFSRLPIKLTMNLVDHGDRRVLKVWFLLMMNIYVILDCQVSSSLVAKWKEEGGGAGFLSLFSSGERWRYLLAPWKSMGSQQKRRNTTLSSVLNNGLCYVTQYAVCTS